MICVTFSMLFSCQQDAFDCGDTKRVYLQTGSESNVADDVANKLGYSYCLFQAAANGREIENIPDLEYELIEKANKALSKTELDTLSFHFQNFEIENKVYKLLISATPKDLSETALMSISGELAIGTLFSDVVISMIKEDDKYRMLSKDNYYSVQSFTGMDVVENDVLTIQTGLQRSVGQLVFDIYKVAGNNINNPVPIDVDTVASVLDRVDRIRIKTTQFSWCYSISQDTSLLSPDGLIEMELKTNLNTDYHVDPDAQDTTMIKGLITKNNNPIGGGMRVYGPYLLSSKKETGRSVKAVLSFSYYDTTLDYTTPANDDYKLIDLENGLQLNLPTGKNKGVIYVEKNSYTVNNIGIPNNRIIDIDVSGNITIDTSWDRF